jgi:hypothetical protein
MIINVCIGARPSRVAVTAEGRQPLPTTDSFLAFRRPDLDLAVNNYSCLIKG